MRVQGLVQHDFKTTSLRCIFLSAISLAMIGGPLNSSAKKNEINFSVKLRRIKVKLDSRPLELSQQEHTDLELGGPNNVCFN